MYEYVHNILQPIWQTYVNLLHLGVCVKSLKINILFAGNKN